MPCLVSISKIKRLLITFTKCLLDKHIFSFMYLKVTLFCPLKLYSLFSQNLKLPTKFTLGLSQSLPGSRAVWSLGLLYVVCVCLGPYRHVISAYAFL